MLNYTLNWGEGPKPWITSKLLWNPYQNVDSLLNVWYVKTAGEKAAPKLKEFYSVWEKFWTSDIHSLKWDTHKGQWLPYSDLSYLKLVPRAYINRCDSLMQDAYNLAGSNNKGRVLKLQEMWQVYRAAVLSHANDNTSVAEKNASNAQFVDLLNKLGSDSLHRQSVQRIKSTFKIP